MRRWVLTGSDGVNPMSVQTIAESGPPVRIGEHVEVAESAESAGASWAVLVSNGQRKVQVYGPFDEALAKRVAIAHNVFATTLGFAEVARMDSHPRKLT